MKNKGLSIWFLIGLQLSIYGLLIAGSGIYEAVNSTASTNTAASLHAGIWWGALMLLLGLFYIVKFRPKAGD